MAFRTIITVSLFLFSVSLCTGRDVYVSQKFGDDRNTGMTMKNDASGTGPVRTIRRALELAEPCDSLVLDPSGGPYRESISLVGRKHGGDPRHPFVIEGSGAVLDGTESLPKAIWQHFQGDVYRFQLTMLPADWKFFHLLDHGDTLPKAESAPNAKQVPDLQPREWVVFQGFVYFRAESNQSPCYGDTYDLAYSARQTGVTLVQVNHVRIHDLTVQGFQIDGVSAANGAQYIVLDGVSCRNNGRSGLTLGGASTVNVGYGKFDGNRTTQVLSKPYSHGLLFNCDVPEGGATFEPGTDSKSFTLTVKQKDPKNEE